LGGAIYLWLLRSVKVSSQISVWEQVQVNARVVIYGADFFFLAAAIFAADIPDGRSWSVTPVARTARLRGHLL
jgi:hypothetical protein